MSVRGHMMPSASAAKHQPHGDRQPHPQDVAVRREPRHEHQQQAERDVDRDLLPRTLQQHAVVVR